MSFDDLERRSNTVRAAGTSSRAAPGIIGPRASTKARGAVSSAVNEEPEPAILAAMRRVAQRVRKCRRKLSPRRVHALRIALRACRSLAALHHHGSNEKIWRNIRRASRRLAHALAPLREAHALAELVLELDPDAKHDASSAQIGRIERRGKRAKKAARAAVDYFDLSRWRKWARKAAKLATAEQTGASHAHECARAHLDSVLAADSATRTSHAPVEAYHDLRIYIKRLRNVLDAHVPLATKQQRVALKSMQDVLGQAHDIHALIAELDAADEPGGDSAAWLDTLRVYANKHLAAYRELAGDNGETLAALRQHEP